MLENEQPTIWTPTATEGSVNISKRGRITANQYNPETEEWEGCTQCARWANDALRRFNSGATYRGIAGNAWNRLSKGKIIYSGYTGLDRDTTGIAAAKAAYQTYLKTNKIPKGLSSNTVYGRTAQKENLAAAENFAKNFDMNQLDTNKIYMINMFYKGSPFTAVAKYECTDDISGTHTGNVYYNKEKKEWEAADNIHGKVRINPLTKLIGSKGQTGVTAISEVKQSPAIWAKIKSLGSKLKFWKDGGSMEDDESDTEQTKPAVVTGIQNSTAMPSIFVRISNPPETYTDGYGVEREVYEPKIITAGRAVYNALFGEPEVNGIKIKASTAPLPTMVGKLPTITKRGVAILNAAKEGDAARAVSLIPDYYGEAFSQNPARTYWPKIKEIIKSISGSGKLTGKQAKTVLKSKPMQHIFNSYKSVLGQQPTSSFSSNAWYDGVIKSGKNIENASSNVKSMYQARLNRATKSLEDANGVVTKIGADGKPFKIYPKGMSLRTTSFETGLPTQFANDFSIDDIGQYVVIDGSKFHLYKRGGGLKIK